MNNKNLLQHEIISIENITPHPKNYRKHSDQQIQQLMASLIRFGQARSICVQEKEPGKYIIVAGEGIWRAAKLLGWQSIKADIFPASVSETEIHAYIVADNKLQGHDVDEEALFLLLQEQEKAGFDLELLGSSEAELQKLQREIEQQVIYQQQQEEEQPELVFSKTIPQLTKKPEVSQEDSFQQPQPFFIPKPITEIPSSPSTLTPKEWVERFEGGLLRQIVLTFGPDEFTWILARFKQIKERVNQSQSNTDIVVALVNYYIDQEGLPDLSISNPFQEKAL